MKIKSIKITDFKSIYGTQEFNFEEYNGLVKLSGPIGVGKTTLGEAILYGLYGTVKGQNNSSLISWNAKSCEVEMYIMSKNREIHIIRNIHQPLIIEVNGKTLAGSNKRDTQSILEEDLFDVPKLAIQKMCIISFNAFNSLAAMNPGETKIFLDDIFGFKIFSEYNNEIVLERKDKQNESIRLNAIYTDTLEQINHLEKKKDEQKKEAENSIDIQSLNFQRETLVNEGKSYKEQYNNIDTEYKEKESEIDKIRLSYYNEKLHYATLGKQHKEWLKKFESGTCPTCGHKIDESSINIQKEEMLKCADNYREQNKLEETEAQKLKVLKEEHSQKLLELTNKMNDLKTKIHNIDSEIVVYNNNIKLINENYDDIIMEYEQKAKQVKEELSSVDFEIAEWNEMVELFTKTLRYNLLDTLIPHINRSIKYFINKLDQPYTIEYDQEFKPHILIDTYDKEISYNNLSTGQKKSLDMAIIFGILQNIISNVDFNIFFLDELFSNLDSDSRNTMLQLLNETLSENRTIFVINHAEMNDDYFSHKIRVSLESKNILTKKKEEVMVKSSKYTKVF